MQKENMLIINSSRTSQVEVRGWVVRNNYLFVQVGDEQDVGDSAQGRLGLAVHRAGRRQREGPEAGQSAAICAGRECSQAKEWGQHAGRTQTIHWKGRDYELLRAFLVVVIFSSSSAHTQQTKQHTITDTTGGHAWSLAF